MASSLTARAKRLASASERLREDVAEMQTAIYAAYQALRRGETRRARTFLEPFAVLENPHFDDDLADDDFEEA